MSSLSGQLGKSLLRAVSLIELLGESRRALSSWVTRSRTALVAQAFLERATVKERSLYIDLGTSQPALSAASTKVWIWGAGGTGKSTLAFELGRRALNGDLFLPVLVDFGWRGDLTAYVAASLSLHEQSQQPTNKQAARLIDLGLVGLIVDGVTEAAREGVLEELVELASVGSLKHVIVTGRSPCPRRDLFQEVHLGSLDEQQLRLLVNELMPCNDDGRERAFQALLRFAGESGLTPLFARMAIEQFVETGQMPADSATLLQEFLLSIRSRAPGALSESDFLRACRVVSLAWLSDGFRPRDITEDYLYGALDAARSTRPFLDGHGRPLTTFAVIEELISCGLLYRRIVNTVARLDFFQHPIGEFLAAAEIMSLPLPARGPILAEVHAAPTPSAGFLSALRQIEQNPSAPNQQP